MSSDLETPLPPGRIKKDVLNILLSLLPLQLVFRQRILDRSMD